VVLQCFIVQNATLINSKLIASYDCKKYWCYFAWRLFPDLHPINEVASSKIRIGLTHSCLGIRFNHFVYAL